MLRKFHTMKLKVDHEQITINNQNTKRSARIQAEFTNFENKRTLILARIDPST